MGFYVENVFYGLLDLCIIFISAQKKNVSRLMREAELFRTLHNVAVILCHRSAG